MGGHYHVGKIVPFLHEVHNDLKNTESIRHACMCLTCISMSNSVWLFTLMVANEQQHE